MSDPRAVTEPVLVMDGLIVNEVYSPAQTLQNGTEMPEGPAIGFQFSSPALGLIPNIVVVGLSDREMDELVRAVRNAVKVARRHRLRSPIPPPGPVHCPGCNLRLHGEVAKRGACVKCFPTLPGDEGR